MNDVSKIVEVQDVKNADKSKETAEQERHGIGYSLNNVSVDFYGIQALNAVNLSAAPGEKLGIIGNSGSGKTTLCDLLTGLVSPSVGNVTIKDNLVKRTNPQWFAKQGVRRIFQNPIFFDDLTVQENVMLGLPPSKGDGLGSAFFFPKMFYKQHRETALRIMEYCDIDVGLADKKTDIDYPTRKKIELARSLMGNPRILIIDEPTISLTEDQSAKYIQVVQDYVDTFSTTLVIVERELDVIRTLCDRAIAIDAGSVLADGQVAQVLRNNEVVNRNIGQG